jgi:Ca-activated chloride channel homolog
MLARMLAVGLILLLCGSAGTDPSDGQGIAAQLLPATTAMAQAAGREAEAVGDQEREAPQTGYAVKVAVDSVFLNVSVQERNSNRSLAGLKKEDFLVYEDGVLQQVEQFLPSEAPFNLLLLLDVSGSTGLFLHLMRGASIDFVRQLKANDRVAIATFSARVDLIENFTTDRTGTEKTLERIWARGGTAFYDALMTCISEYMHDLEGRGAVVVFTDGIDNQLDGGYPSPSQTTFDQLYSRVQESESTIYPIFLDTEGKDAVGPTIVANGGARGTSRTESSTGPYPDRKRNPTLDPSASNPESRKRQGELAPYELAMKQLQMIADQTGGHMYRPRKIQELFGIYSEIASDLRIQYQLGYNPSNHAHDGSWRELRVEIKGHPEAVVRTRKGYFARKDAGR